jgi:hypothetical protein
MYIQTKLKNKTIMIYISQNKKEIHISIISTAQALSNECVWYPEQSGHNLYLIHPKPYDLYPTL